MATSPSGPKPKLTNRGFLQYASMGFQMLAIIVVFVLIGRYADTYFQLKIPVFTLVFALAGVGGSMYSIIRKL